MSIALRLRRELAPVIYFGTRHACNVCGHRLRRFVPLGEILDGKFTEPLMIGGEPHPVTDYETLNVPEFMCPICGSQDKARLYALFMDSLGHEGFMNSPSTMLHFAPEGGLSAWIRRSFPDLEYVTADLHRPDVDVQLDVTRMETVGSDSYDSFIFSHVLEHVDDETSALAELGRILKPGAWGIIMVPILLTLVSTYSDPSIVAPEERARHFGLEDHLRVHSRQDFLALLRQAGFEVYEFSVANWSEAEFARLGIAKGSVLYVVVKP